MPRPGLCREDQNEVVRGPQKMRFGWNIIIRNAA
jgi:hypothetical protein